METTIASIPLTMNITVLTVPMRNGNRTFMNIFVSGIAGSYRTYEEWKLFLNGTMNRVKLVLTVPMRNGNNNLSSAGGVSSESSYRTYEEWKPAIIIGVTVVVRVLTVPMRNGNVRCSKWVWW